MLTYSQKKYLFAIYKLGQNGNEVRSADVAKIVGVSKASTVTMTERLRNHGYIEKEYYGQIALTEKGVKEANDLFTKCLIIQDFLHTSLGVSTEKADTDSVAVVAHVSEETADRFADFILKVKS
jgi:DtxR family Mn-dependent transcriptional regulator